MKKTLMAAAATSLALAAGTAMAQDGQRGERMFDRIDLNGDGTITQAEMEDFSAERFVAMDVNGDGLVSLTEMEEASKRRSADRAGRRFERLAADGNGVVDRSELLIRVAERFERLDADGNGAVTKTEARDQMRRRKGG
ncbi:MAG: hypothetical protein AAGK00_16950 [Pseudomonadota bacterium]